LKKEGLKTTLTEWKQNSSMEIMQCKEDNKKDFNYSHEMQKMIEGER